MPKSFTNTYLVNHCRCGSHSCTAGCDLGKWKTVLTSGWITLQYIWQDKSIYIVIVYFKGNAACGIPHNIWCIKQEAQRWSTRLINVLGALSRRFFHLLPCAPFSHCYMFMLRHKRGFEMEWEFSLRISFPVIIIFLPGGKAVRFLRNPLLNTNAEWQREENRSDRREYRRGGMDQAEEGRPSQMFGTIWPTEWLSFVRIQRERVGGKQRASDSVWSLGSQTWSLCRHTPPHTSLNRARKHINKPRLTSPSLY